MEILIRLKKILSYYNLTSSTFADTIEVQRSSISHLLSGRNKPSLDFVMKTVNKFPEVDLYWFLYGEGEFPKKEKIVVVPEIEEDKEETKPTLLSQDKNLIEKVDLEMKTPNIGNKKLVKIILLYNDGSFNEFNQ
ncbi:helix-turn-helix domain-containing protein [Tenacibaculum dicentrarchi]|nr:helix-turn-helix domain-containing protein [Tenacibaculum dicentrarchi]MCD8415495.1 helix-turn-helix domain-containing protein [Tenacibaculum dicentrarchi]MCD8420619.1 helix-turn-helix domain-containing protein [Tenacibaculum dicentrarchi]MCD8425677.1 helix-turn-helix domain-containing protein [Tenacibaculum dicentrarchi]MCD8435334.1 helix-turn-helix domain-containing protein [Tenacibaculum dicentrarchi]